MAERAIAETGRAAEDMRTALSRIKEPARKVATSGDGRVPKAAAKARTDPYAGEECPEFYE